MAAQVNYFELQTTNALPQGFVQTPIFIGTATKEVVVPMEPGVFSLAIPQAEEGTVLDQTLIEGLLTYWKVFGRATISTISPERTSLRLTGAQSDFTSTRDELKVCNLFILDGGAVVFCAPIDSVTFSIVDGSFFIEDAHLLVPLPSILPTMLCVLAYPKQVSTFDFEVIDGRLEVSPLPFGLVASNVSTLIRSQYSFFYNVMDFRWGRYNYDDVIPASFVDNPHSQLGLVAKHHRLNTKTDMTLYSVPSNTLASMQKVLAEIVLAPRKYGYAIVPLWIDDQVSNAVAAYVRTLETNRTGFQIAYLTHTPKTGIEVFGKDVSVRALHQEWVQG